MLSGDYHYDNHDYDDDDDDDVDDDEDDEQDEDDDDDADDDDDDDDNGDQDRGRHLADNPAVTAPQCRTYLHREAYSASKSSSSWLL